MTSVITAPLLVGMHTGHLSSICRTNLDDAHRNDTAIDSMHAEADLAVAAVDAGGAEPVNGHIQVH